MLVLVLPYLVWFWITKRKSSLIIFLLTLISCIFIGVCYLYSVNGEWYLFYVFSLPNSIGKDLNYFRVFFAFSDYIFSYCGIGSVLILIYTFAKFPDQGKIGNEEFAITFPFCLREASLRFPVISLNFVPWIVVCQFLALLYNPHREDLVDLNDSDKIASETFIRELREMKGNVLLQAHSFLPTMAGKHSYANILPYSEVAGMNNSISRELQTSLNDAYKKHYFSNIIADQITSSPPGNIPYYAFSKTCNDSLLVSFRSRFGYRTTTPRYVFLPLSDSNSSQFKVSQP